MFFKNKIKKKKEFDSDSWKAFVRYTAIQKFGTHGDINHEFAPNRVFVKFSYLDNEYNYLTYRIRKDGDIAVCVDLFLPETEENKNMSSRLINRCGTVSGAIRYIADISI